jgi:hypothetical protein
MATLASVASKRRGQSGDGTSSGGCVGQAERPQRVGSGGGGLSKHGWADGTGEHAPEAAKLQSGWNADELPSAQNLVQHYCVTKLNGSYEATNPTYCPGIKIISFPFP